MRADEGEGLAIAGGGFPRLATRRMDHAQSIVAVVDFGVTYQQFARGVLGVVELAGLD